MIRCGICGRTFHSMGFASHRAMHNRAEQKRLEQMKKGRSTSMEASMDEYPAPKKTHTFSYQIMDIGKK